MSQEIFGGEAARHLGQVQMHDEIQLMPSSNEQPMGNKSSKK